MTEIENQNRSFFFMFYSKVDLLLNVPKNPKLSKEIIWDFLFAYSLAASFNLSAALSRFCAPFSSSFPVLDWVVSIAFSNF